MDLVGAAIDEIGFTWFQFKLFCVSGTGYAVDSMILLCQSIIAQQAALEFHNHFPARLTIAAYVGMLVGAPLWGVSADIIGRKVAFNSSLILCSVFAILVGLSPHWIVLGTFLALCCMAAAGNLALDTTVCLEYFPNKYRWLLTMMAAWWGVGHVVVGILNIGFMRPRFSCDDPSKVLHAAHCNFRHNMGWRFVFATAGLLVGVFYFLRIFFVALEETPTHLIIEGKDNLCVELLLKIADKYKRPCPLALSQLQACGEITVAPKATKRWRPRFTRGFSHIRGLFATKQMAKSTSLLWLSWTLIGLAYPLFTVFLPSYLSTRSAAYGHPHSSLSDKRDYILINLTGIFGPLLAGLTCRSRILGRKYTMLLGSLLASASLFGYVYVKTERQSFIVASATAFFVTFYYGTLFGYTAEVLPDRHRGTGNGIAIAVNRLMGVLVAVVATAANTKTATPIYICAGLYIGIAVVTVFLSREHR